MMVYFFCYFLFVLLGNQKNYDGIGSNVCVERRRLRFSTKAKTLKVSFLDSGGGGGKH